MSGRKPTHNVYAQEPDILAKRNGREQKPRLTRVGVAWQASGDTLQITIESLPLYASGHASLRLVAFSAERDSAGPRDNDVPDDDGPF